MKFSKSHLFLSLTGPQHDSDCCLCLPFSTVAQAAACFALRRLPHCQQGSGRQSKHSPAERVNREETQSERPARSTAERCTMPSPAPPPLPLRDTQMLGCCLPPIHTASFYSHTQVLPHDDQHLLRRGVTRLEKGTVAQEAAYVSLPLGMSSFLLPPL